MLGYRYGVLSSTKMSAVDLRFRRRVRNIRRNKVLEIEIIIGHWIIWMTHTLYVNIDFLVIQ
jgi:hypothetical protein